MGKEKEKELPVEEQACDAPGPEETTEQEEEIQLSEQELLQQKYDQLNDQHLRLMAEYDNFRKRTQREKDDLYAGATAASVEKFLAVWDNMERASAYETGSDEFRQGFELIVSGFEEVLKGFGVESFGEAGDAFDPNRHYAVSHIEDESLGDNVVSQVMQKGYRIGERVVRYAMVQTAN